MTIDEKREALLTERANIDFALKVLAELQTNGNGATAHPAVMNEHAKKVRKAYGPYVKSFQCMDCKGDAGLVKYTKPGLKKHKMRSHAELSTRST